MRVNTNIQAINSHRSMKVVSDKASKASEKLSSGLKINKAADDAAGLAISEKMRAQIGGLDRASLNAQDGISMIQTAEGAMQETHTMLNRMRELTVQASNDTLVTSDKLKIKDEMNQLFDEMDAIGTRTEFNTKKLLAGSHTKGIHLQVGANADQSIRVTIGTLTVKGLFENNGATVLKDKTKFDEKASGGTMTAYLKDIDKAIDKVSTQRAKLGATQNRLDHTVKNLDIASENLSASESRIRDTDMAKEMMNYTKGNVLTQAAQSMLAQANQQPQSVLQLLG